jgi:hypothetical protein
METDEDRRHDPAFEPVYEAGGGEAEGFEEAEEMLIEEAENAEHTSALDEGFPAEDEDYPERTTFGDADEVVKDREVLGEEGDESEEDF